MQWAMELILQHVFGIDVLHVYFENKQIAYHWTANSDTGHGFCIWYTISATIHDCITVFMFIYF